MASLFKTDIQKLKGVGSKSAECLKRLGICTVGDIISFYPRMYEDWTSTVSLCEAKGKKERCVKLKILSDVKTVRTKSGKFIYKLEATDGTNFADIVFFNSKYTAGSLKKGNKYLFRGNVFGNLLKFELASPQIKKPDESLALYPVYRSVKGISSAKIMSLVKNALDLLPDSVAETLPPDIIQKNNLCSLDFAVKNMHFPKARYDLEVARKRIIFEEFFVYRLAMNMIKAQARQKTQIILRKSYLKDFEKLFPFKLTAAQKDAIKQCENDIKSGYAMNRLLQGDVGSGKTAVAAALAYNVARSGYQVALMAPTEILAAQHYKTFLSLFKSAEINIDLIYGSLKAKEKNAVLKRVSDGNLQIIIGTHSLISDNVKFKNLGLIITDEQHRFGVKQRESLVSKGIFPHVLVMSATPIPRTLALILYGDLDISVLSETLPGRQKIDTFRIDSGKRQRAWKFIRKIIDEGGQSYIVCAGIEDGGDGVEDVKSYKEKMLKNDFAPDEVDILHGKMTSSEKDDVMKKFIDGKLKVLVATTVIEVGIDVPGARVIVIENAEKFGISQLHQLRGRVGRSSNKSYCVLVSDSKSKDSSRRLAALTDSYDGFYLSEEDLKIRGPGDFFGVNQHGVPNIGINTSYGDINIVKQAQDAAEELIRKDPALNSDELKFIRYKLKNIFKNSQNLKTGSVIV